MNVCVVRPFCTSFPLVRPLAFCGPNLLLILVKSNHFHVMLGTILLLPTSQHPFAVTLCSLSVLSLLVLHCFFSLCLLLPSLFTVLLNVTFQSCVLQKI